MESDRILILKGNIIFTPDAENFKIHQDSYLIACNGVISEICTVIPEKYQGIAIHDYGTKLIIPGFVDLHTHAAQFNQRGLGLDYKLLEWLNEYTFQEENKFSDPSYAALVYEAFADELIAQGTTRVVVFATVHQDSSRILFDILARKGIGAYVGKVNMDNNCPAFMKEDTQASLQATEELIKEWVGNALVKPIITPRFAPTSTRDLLKGLGNLAKSYQLPVQSHLSENPSEIEWVKELFPELMEYHRVYLHYNLFGQTPTLMAHCVHLSDAAIQSMKENQVVAVHCPDSNMNLTSGIMPVRKLLNAGVKVGLGSDVGAGHSLSMAQTIVKTIQLSKISYTLDNQYEALTLPEVFYMATKGGGSFFGQVGSFEPGYCLDALVIDNKMVGSELSPAETLQHFIYTGNPSNIVVRYIAGRQMK